MSSRTGPAQAGDATTPAPPAAAPEQPPAEPAAAPDVPTREQLLAFAESLAYARAGHNAPVNEPTETPGE